MQAVTDHAGAVAAVREHHYEISFDFERICYECRQEWPCETIALLRAYEAVVAERDFIAASGTVVQAGVDFVKNHADQLATLRAQHAALVKQLDAARALVTRWQDEYSGEFLIGTITDELLATLGGAEGV